MSVDSEVVGDGARRRMPPQATFVAPSLPDRLIERADLVRRLGAPGAADLTLVTGPPGSGKTVLTRVWLDRSATPWIWITVDRLLASSHRFWQAFVLGIQRIVGDLVLDAVDVISAETIIDQDVVEVLVDDLLRQPRAAGAIVVVVDDAHLLGAEVGQALEWLVHHQPAALHLVLVSRSDPPFSVARLRAQGVMTEVRSADLALDRAETEALLNTTARAGIDWSVYAERLHRDTDGWLAGLRLAVASMERGVSPDRVIAQLGSATGSIGELLVSEALDSQPAFTREFLQRTSVLDVVEPALCDVVTGRHDSRELLQRLSRDHLFVAPLDTTLPRYRYHPLLAEILRLELRSHAPAAEADIHRAAAQWLRDQSRYPEAIIQALRGDQYDFAFEMITAHLPDLYADGYGQDVGRWLLALPDAGLLADPERTVEHCGALLFIVRPEWLRWLARARAIVGPDRPDLTVRLHLFQSLAWAGQGRQAEFDREVALADSLRGSARDETWDEVVGAWDARLSTLRGDHRGAVKLARRVNERDRRLISDLPAISLLAATLHAAGDTAGLDMAQEAVASWRAGGERHLFGMTDALCVASEAALSVGDTDEAENLASSAVAMTSFTLPNLLTVRASLALSKVDVALGRTPQASTRLDEVRATLVRQNAANSMIELVVAAMPGEEAQRPPSQRPQLIDELTVRELTILRYLSSHLTFPEIAAELYISRHTVKTHVARIYRKLGVASRSGAVGVGRDLGLL